MHFLPRSWLMALLVITATPALAQDTAAAVDVVVDAGNDVAAVADDAGVAVATVDDPAAAPRPAFDDHVINDAGAPLVTTTDVIITFLKAMAALCVVLALAWLTLGKGIPKLVEKAQAGKRVKVIERIALDARRSLFLVEIDGRLMVLGGGDVVKVHDLQEARDKDKAARFAEVLSTTTPTPPISGAQPPAEQS